MTSRRPDMSPNIDETDVESVARESAGDVEAIAEMVSDALDAPVMPASLSKRLDEEIGRRWGQSPELMPRPAGVLRSTADWGTRQLRSWRGLAATVAAAVVMVVLFNGSGGSAWAAMRAALEKQGLLEIRDDDTVRWLDLSQLVAGRQSESGSEFVDLNRRIILTRSSSTAVATEQSFPAGVRVGGDVLVLAFLNNEPLSARTFQRLDGVRIEEESTTAATFDGQETVNLHVRFGCASGDQISVQVACDSESKLPVAVPAQAGSADSDDLLLAVVPSLNTVDGIRGKLFPNSNALVAENATGPGRDDENPPVEPLMAAGNGTSPSGDQVVAQLPSALPMTVPAVTSSLPTGAAKQWRPVAVVSRSDAAVLERVNQELVALWNEKGVTPVEPASDVQLLRRAYLDLAGRTPTVREVRDYINDAPGGRYERLIERLLDSPDHASQLAAVWRSFLIPEGVDLDAFGGTASFEKWLAERFAAGEPYDQIVRKLLLAEGRLAQSGPLLFYSALKLDADQLAARTSRAFLGMRLECAQCHDHPFEPWTQSDFWSYAAFFAQISRPRGELENASTVMQVRDVNRGEVMMPYSDEAVPPRFLGTTEEVALTADDAAASGRRQALSNWLTGSENPYFARATVNRLWAYLFGRGIVDPVDDFGVNNPPVSPELLDTLASQLIESNFDLRNSIRTIVLSNAYRLDSSSGEIADSPEEAEKRLTAFAQMNVKTLTAEQLYDCIAVATLLDPSGGDADFTLSRFGNSQRDLFLQTFAAPSASRSEYLAGIPQVLTLMNGGLISGATAEGSSGMIRSLQAPFFTDAQRINILFMATLSRPATDDEVALLADLIPADATEDQRFAALSDMLWALINSSEFALNH